MCRLCITVRILKWLDTPFFNLIYRSICFHLDRFFRCRLLLERDRHILNHWKNVYFVLWRRPIIRGRSFWNFTFLLFPNWVTILLWYQVLFFWWSLSFFLILSFDFFLFRFFVFSSTFGFLLFRNHICFALLTDLYGQITAHLLGSNILPFKITGIVFLQRSISRIQN